MISGATARRLSPRPIWQHTEHLQRCRLLGGARPHDPMVERPPRHAEASEAKSTGSLMLLLGGHAHTSLVSNMPINFGQMGNSPDLRGRIYERIGHGPPLGSGPIDGEARYDSGSLRETGVERPILADGRADCASGAVFPKSYGKPRGRVLSGIIVVNLDGLHWRDAPKDYGLHKTLYNRWKRWGDKGSSFG